MLNEHTTLTLGALCQACGLHAEELMALVDQGIVTPYIDDHGQWHFPACHLARIRTAMRLQEDLALNLAGAALAVELLDEVRSLRARVRTLEHQLAVEDWEISPSTQESLI